MITLYQRMISERKRLQSELHSIHSQVLLLPEGKLTCAKNGNHYKWYHSHGTSRTYIPKTNRQLAERLACKKYLSLKAERLEHELIAVNAYLKHHDAYIQDPSEELLKIPGYAELLSLYFQPESEELQAWMNAPYEKSSYRPEDLVHKTLAGISVRSKSEAMIVSLLSNFKLPFRYECCLPLGEISFFPDFTIKHPKTGKIYYWEHFGKMDDSSYAARTFTKLDTYCNYGIIPGINLITTYETANHPLDYEQIYREIKFHLLDD